MVLNSAHRGARSLAPENTLAAIEKGFQVGAHLWETDISVTRDGALVLFHDNTVERTTDALTRFPGRESYAVSDFTLDELRQLDAGSWFVHTDPFGQIKAGAVSAGEAESFRGLTIPTLKEGLAFTASKNWPVNLEIKTLLGSAVGFPVVEKALSEVKQSCIAPSQVFFSSFDHRLLDEIKEKAPEFAIQALIGDTGEPKNNWGDLTYDTYNANQAIITPDELRAIVARGKTVNLWTVNDPQRMQAFIEVGATTLITDFPQVLKTILAHA
ncbi:glycerophosphodiester phosphodiesterase [Desulfoluna spongiiphila]|uniref:glycerophosphodiester phosphodiesterase n=1 Tax=Desulfoluna spongiiphila TaxID=419481 RepID=UPI0012511647|nr:glycerophosphodiester phosphodiesterase family protein [Desulfoluna spongiiphila]VVS94233.1 glycerophosphodiester phosphodiesterase domain [Desulfoluna spongiiphila]